MATQRVVRTKTVFVGRSRNKQRIARTALHPYFKEFS
jgi:hypothetical protein